ncbi:synaptonemal complex protein 1-like isoform X2 [Dysidea avara]|uniref:synaptonemal complex protein 1-like isoform X2 n=1 Tax=Dysidea avara TaxID=196820 RepID=UPI00332A9CA5
MQQQPFFKMSGNAHYFSLERFNSHFGQEPKSAVQRQNTQSNFFKQPAMAKVQEMGSEAEQQQQQHSFELSGDEKMSGLYSRIHQEAEKLQKWKTAVVTELKEKEQKLEEASGNNEMLRKSLVDLQVVNENLSSNLQNEKLANQEIRQQMLTTRNMCMALKDHVTRVEATIEQEEVDKEIIKANDQDVVNTYQELMDQFKQLQLESSSRQEDLELKVEHHEKQQALLISSHKSSIFTSNQTIQSLEDDIANLKTATEQLQCEVDNKAGRCVELQESLNTVNVELQSNKEENDNKRIRIETLSGNLKTALHDNECLHTKMDQLTHEVEETQLKLATKEEMLSSMEQSNCQLQGEVEHLSMTVKSSDKKFELCQKQLAEANSNVVKLQSDATSLKDTLEKYEVDIRFLVNDKELLGEQLIEAKDELKHTMQKMDEEKILVSDEKASVEAELNKVTKEHNEEMELVCRKLAETYQSAAITSNCTMENINGESASVVVGLIASCLAILQSKQEEAQLVSRKYASKIDELEDRVKELQQSLSDVNVKLVQQEKLLADNEKTGQSNVNSLEKEVKALTKQVSSLTSKNSKLQAQLENKLRTIDDLKSEVKKYHGSDKETGKLVSSLNQQLDRAVKEKDDFISQYTVQIEQLNQLVVRKDETNTDLQEKETTVRAELTKTTELFQNALNETKAYKEQSLTYQKLQDDNKKKFDQEISEMCATLEKYKAENQKTVVQKDKEIQLLTERSSNAAEESLKLQAELTKLKWSLDNLTQEKVSILPVEAVSTPQLSIAKGILRQDNASRSGNKRVAFVSSGSDHSDTETLEESRKLPNALLAERSTPSPNVRVAPTFRHKQKDDTTVKRLHTSNKKICVTPNDEIKQFKELYPNYAPLKKSKELKVGSKKSSKPNLDVKGTPNKSLKYSSLAKQKKNVSKATSKIGDGKQPDMSWFELDPIFGFSAED